MNKLIRLLYICAALLLWGPVAIGQSAPSYVVYGSSDLNMAACSQEGPVGRITSNFSVLRRFDIAGPTQIKVKNLPIDVSVAFSPTSLTYPGGVMGQQVTGTFTVNAGVAIPDVVVQIEVSDPTNAVAYDLLLHGICPRHNKDFVIRGWFESTQLGKTFPVESALVEIYRDVPYQLDQFVGSTITGADGSYDVKLWANDADTYYAKLRLNDVAGVYLHEGGNPSIKDYNSSNRGSNAQPVIDLGGTNITVDGGSGTPKSAVWQGGHAAFQEFIHTFGAPPPTGDYEIAIQYTKSSMTWTARSTTNWEEGTQTYKYSTGAPTAPTDAGFDPYFSQFFNYSTNFHEFGHALRHTIDGDQRHFTDDASRWTYARGHNWCGSTLIDVVAFGFNEGWAEFWALDTGDDVTRNCPGLPLDDMAKEGSVMNDLHKVAQAISACQPKIAKPDEAFQAQRRNLFSILNRGQNIIHSEGEFRNNAMEQFPGCPLPPVGTSVAADPTAMKGSIPPKLLASRMARLGRRVEFYRAESRRRARALATVTPMADNSRNCNSIPCKTFVEQLIRPAVLRGQMEYANLIGQSLARRYAELRHTSQKAPELSSAVIDRDHERDDLFRRATLKIVLEMLDTSGRLLDRYSKRDRTGQVGEIAAELRRTARRLQLRAPLNDELFTLLELPKPPDDDQTRPSAKRKYDSSRKTARHGD
jgi:hypothetical protein